MIHDISEYARLLTELLVLGTVIYNIRISRRVSSKVEEVHKATNGLTARLEEASKREGIAVGTALGIQQQKDLTK